MNRLSTEEDEAFIPQEKDIKKHVEHQEEQPQQPQDEQEEEALSFEIFTKRDHQ